MAIVSGSVIVLAPNYRIAESLVIPIACRVLWMFSVTGLVFHLARMVETRIPPVTRKKFNIPNYELAICTANTTTAKNSYRLSRSYYGHISTLIDPTKLRSCLKSIIEQKRYPRIALSTKQQPEHAEIQK